MGRKGCGRARARRPGRRRCLPDGSGRQGARRLRAAARAARQGRGDRAPSGPGPHLLGPEIRVPRSPGRRRQTHRRCPRPGGEGDARLDREERGRDPDAGQGEREDGPRRRPGDRRRHLPPRHLAQPRPPAPYPCRARQHGQGPRRYGGRQVAHHGQRGPLRAPEAHRHALPQRAGERSLAPRLRHREDPRRRAFRDRRRFPRRGRGVLDAARRDRGGDGRAQPRDPGGQPPPRRTLGADDPGGQARHRPRRAHRRLGEAGRRSRLRCGGAGCGGGIEDRRTGHDGPGNGAGDGCGGTGHGGCGGRCRGPVAGPGSRVGGRDES